jgi:uncharacterized protein (DUF2336 family)
MSANAAASQFAKLLTLAKAPDSDARRELLRQVTDLFFVTAGSHTQTETALFDDVLRSVAADMQDGVLVELSQRFAEAPNPPTQLFRDLANHALPVAEPILRRSKAISEDDLIGVVRARSQGHIRLVASRTAVSEKLSDAIVTHGDDTAVDELVRNAGAQISRSAMEAVVDRARSNRALHEGVVGRRDTPLDLLNEMYFVVEQRLRENILGRNASVDPAELDAALEKTRARLQKAAAKTSDDLRRAERFIQMKKDAGELTPSLLISLYRDKQFNHFIAGLAELTGLDFDTARGVIQRRDLDALAMICRAAEMERPLFVTIAVLCSGGDQAMNRAEEFGKIYMAVPVDAARRAMRFYQVRKSADTVAA